MMEKGEEIQRDPERHKWVPRRFPDVALPDGWRWLDIPTFEVLDNLVHVSSGGEFLLVGWWRFGQMMGREKRLILVNMRAPIRMAFLPTKDSPLRHNVNDVADFNADVYVAHFSPRHRELVGNEIKLSQMNPRERLAFTALPPLTRRVTLDELMAE